MCALCETSQSSPNSAYASDNGKELVRGIISTSVLGLKAMIRLLLFVVEIFVLFIPYLSSLRFHNDRSPFASSMRRESSASPGLYLERMVERKKIEANAMLKRHEDPNDPIFMRMTYMASECKYNVTKSLKYAANLPENGGTDAHRMTVLVDMKKKSPTVPTNRNIVEFSKADKFCELLTLAGADAFFVNTDEFEYGGTELDLKECAKAAKLARPMNPPAIIHKDIIIHPVQVLILIRPLLHTHD